MITQPVWRALVAFAGIGAIAMATYHFALPTIWGWDAYLAQVPPAVRWGALSINTFFSTMLLLLGLLTLLVAVVSSGGPLVAGVLLAMAVFWLVNALYQILVPMPLPESLAALRVVLVAFAAVMAGLNVIALVAPRAA